MLSFSDYTNQAFINTYFDYQKVAYGQRKPEKPWETCYTVVDNYFPYAIGRMYIDNYFNQQSRTAVDKLIREVKSAFSSELDRYDWMDGFTLRKSKEKVSKYTFHRIVFLSPQSIVIKFSSKRDESRKVIYILLISYDFHSSPSFSPNKTLRQMHSSMK